MTTRRARNRSLQVRHSRLESLGSRDPVRRFYVAVGLVGLVIVAGTLGYFVLGLSPLDALYMTVITITTVGYREVGHFDNAEQVFTIVLLLVGVGTVLYTLTLGLQVVLEGQLGSAWGRRRMQHDIDSLNGHAIVCGFGRVGRATAGQLSRSGLDVVVIDLDSARFTESPYPYIVGDASDDAVLRKAGVERAAVLVATLDTDAESVYVVLTARSINPDARIIARSRTDEAESKFIRAGADRVVNPQRIGGNRIASFALSPHVVDFLDVVMHEGSTEFVLEDITVRPDAALIGTDVEDLRDREGGGPMLLALRPRGRGFVTDPAPDTAFRADDVLIVVGTRAQVTDLRNVAGDFS